jgi:hypothetical protein
VRGNTERIKSRQDGNPTDHRLSSDACKEQKGQADQDLTARAMSDGGYERGNDDQGQDKS